MKDAPSSSELLADILELAEDQPVTIRIDGRRTRALIETQGPLKTIIPDKTARHTALTYSVGDLTFQIEDIESVHCARYTPGWVIHL